MFVVQAQGHDWNALREAIRKALEMKEWSQQKLAARAGISAGAVTYLLTGREPSRVPRSVPHIERALGWPKGTARMLLAGEITWPIPMSPEVARLELDKLEEMREEFESDARYMELAPEVREHYSQRMDKIAERLRRSADRMIADLRQEITEELGSDACDEMGTRD